MIELKVHVITRHSIRNYGSALQTVATNQLFAELGHNPVFVDYRQPGIGDSSWTYAKRSASKKYGLFGMVPYALLRYNNTRKLGRIFEEYIASQCRLTDRRFGSFSQLAASHEFVSDAAYCVGSDQVWNKEVNKDNRPYYLQFAPRDAIKFSFASSIGMNSLLKEDENELVRALSSFAGISVRESDSAAYLNDLGLKAQVHVDPTLSVGQEFWLAQSDVIESEPYIAVYQLNRSTRFNSILNKVADDVGLPIVRIAYWNLNRSGREVVHVAPTVRTFLTTIRNASVLVTDSFHGCAMATTFGTPLVAVAPPRYENRIYSFLNMVGTLDSLVSDPSDVPRAIESSFGRHSSLPILDVERNRAMKYLAETVGRVQ